MKKYKTQISSLIISFLENLDRELLLSELNKIESEMDKELWLKMTNDSTIVYSITDIKNDIKYSHMPNYKLLVEMFGLVKELDQLEVNII